MKKTLKVFLTGLMSMLLVSMTISGAWADEEVLDSSEIISEIQIQEIKNENKYKALVESCQKAIEKGSAGVIDLSDGDSIAKTPGVQLKGDKITISAAGIYKVSGELNDGKLVIDSDGDVGLILDGVSITNSSNAAIKIKKADRCVIYLADGSENKIVSGTEDMLEKAKEAALSGDEEENTDSENEDSSASDDDEDTSGGAAIEAKKSIAFAGNGSLEVYGYAGNGIATSDNLMIYSGTINVAASNIGIKGKDSFTIEGGIVTVNSVNDGVKSNNSKKDKGNVNILGGQLNINSTGDAICADKNIIMTAGEVNIITEFINSEDKTKESQSEFGGEFSIPEGESEGQQNPGESEGQQNPGESEGQQNPGESESQQNPGESEGQQNPGESESQQNPGESDDNKQEDDQGFNPSEGGSSSGGGSDESCKGFKCGNGIRISGGTITINSVDDAIHSDSVVVIEDGELNIEAGDDGIHAGDIVEIEGGTIDISKSYEGIEGYLININGGDIRVVASDDGTNAGGNSEVFASSLPTLTISGGNVLINASGDGLDSNGNIIVEGGYTIVDGPSNGANGALDSGMENGGELIINGGVVLAIGNSGMAETFSSNSSQASFNEIIDESGQNGSQLVIKDKDGKELISYTATKAFNSVVFSCPELSVGESCTVVVDGKEYTVELESISNGESSGFGASFGGRGGNNN